MQINVVLGDGFVRFEPGRGYMSFVMTIAEAESFAAGKSDCCTDIGTFARYWAPVLTIYYAGDRSKRTVEAFETDYTKDENTGKWSDVKREGTDYTYQESTMRTAEIQIPRQAFRALAKLAKALPNERKRYTVNTARWSRLWGPATGAVTLDVGGSRPLPETPEFSEMLDRVKQIARNSTQSIFQNSRVRLFVEDETSVCWCAYAPNGRTIMNGGIINHGHRKGTQDWSIHT